MYSSSADGRLSDWNAYLRSAENPCHLHRSVCPINLDRVWCSSFIVLTGVCILFLTTASTSNAYDGWNYAVSFVGSIMYGVLFAYSLELFPIRARGTGYAITYTAFRIFSAMVRVWPIFRITVNGDDILCKCSQPSLRYMPTSTRLLLYWSPERYLVLPDSSHGFCPSSRREGL